MPSTRSVSLIVVATVALLVTACGGAAPGPVLTDPTAIVTAALKSTESAKSVHLDATVDGTATVSLGGVGGGTGAPIDVSGTTASADIDFVKPAARATFAIKAGLQASGEVIAVDGMTYIKTTLTGPLYLASPAGAQPIDPSQLSGVIDNLGDLLLKEGVTLVKGDDVACGSQQCYTVSADLTADQLGTSGLGSAAGLPIDLTGASAQAHGQGRHPCRTTSPARRGAVDGGRHEADRRADGLEVGPAGDRHRAAGRPGQTRLLTSGPSSVAERAG